MKKILIMIITSMIIASSFTACQKTPDSEIVIGKGDAALESAIENKSIESGGSVYLAPNTLELALEKNDLKVTVNADVIVTDATEYSVASLSKSKITEEIADNIWETFIGDTVLYKERPWDFKTKSETQQIIIELEEAMSEYEEVAEEDLEHLEKWKEWYKIAPDEYTPVEASKTFENIDYSDLSDEIDVNTLEHIKIIEGEKSISGYALLENNRKMTLNITDISASFIISSSLEEDNPVYQNQTTAISNLPILEKDLDKYADLPVINNDISFTEAEKLAIDAVVSIGATHMSLSNSLNTFQLEQTKNNNGKFVPSGKRPAYVFYFTRELNGVHENIVTENVEFNYSEYMNAVTLAEQIMIMVDDKGIYQFSWTGLKKENEIVSENVELLDFNEVQELFEKQVFLDDCYKYMDSIIVNTDLVIDDKELVINKIELGLTTVLRQGSEDEYLLIPVWDFYGYEKADFGTQDVESWRLYDLTLSENGTATSNLYESVLTINALDGSIIDRTKGY